MKHTHSRRGDLEFKWPDPPLNVVLVNPEIPPNTGNIARLCAATGSRLHLIEPMGFRIDDAKLKRAGLDYWDAISVTVHSSFDAFIAAASPFRIFLFSTGGKRSYLEASYEPGDALVFGCETKGLPDTMLAQFPANVLGIPIQTEHVRSINLSSAVAVVVYEALRQINTQRNPL
jgi:tRNA (cytidine/uridine-2'-O-)-methyltransferase